MNGSTLLPPVSGGGVAGANTSLSNLDSTAVNTDLNLEGVRASIVIQDLTWSTVQLGNTNYQIEYSDNAGSLEIVSVDSGTLNLGFGAGIVTAQDIFDFISAQSNVLQYLRLVISGDPSALQSTNVNEATSGGKLVNFGFNDNNGNIGSPDGTTAPSNVFVADQLGWQTDALGNIGVDSSGMQFHRPNNIFAANWIGVGYDVGPLDQQRPYIGLLNGGPQVSLYAFPFDSGPNTGSLGQVLFDASGEIQILINNTLVADFIPNLTRLSGNLHIDGSLGVGNSLAASTLGTVVGKIEVFNNSGSSLGFVPVYDSIT